MLGRRRALLRLRRRAMCTSALWMKLHKRRDRSMRTSSGRSSKTSLGDSVSDPMFDSEHPDAPSFSSTKMDVDRSSLVSEVNPMPKGDDDPIAEEQFDQMETTVAIPAVPKPKRQIMMLPSVFENRPPVIIFTYTQACLAKQRPLERMVLADINGAKMYYSHTDAVHEYNAVINSLRQGGLYRVKSENRRWSLLWSKIPCAETLNLLKANQKTNHYPGSWHLGRKDLLWRNISRMHRRFGRSYHITPQGYVLPKGTMAWEAARAKLPDALWIWKPCSQSCGRGIKVLGPELSEEDARDLARKRGIVQRYVPNPLLINGYKFDLRVYVTVVSYEPLKVYLNDEGLVRMATEKYTASTDTLDVRTMHLTNYSVNKLSPLFVQNKDGKGADEQAEEAEDGDGESVASKWSFKELQQYFSAHGLDYELMRDRIKDVIIKTLIAVEPQIRGEWARAMENEEAGWAARGASGAHPASCFETYGFDILIDDELKAWLLEVNICPSLSSGSPLDKRIKTKLVADSLTLVGIRPVPSLYRLPGNGKRTSADMNGAVPDDDDSGLSLLPAPEEVEKRKAQLAARNGTDALAAFDEYAWDVVLKSHDEDMRSGGLERIHPTAEAAQYTPYFTEESYASLVLRKWHEAGGGDLFALTGSQSPLPPWVPRQVCFSHT